MQAYFCEKNLKTNRDYVIMKFVIHNHELQIIKRTWVIMNYKNDIKIATDSIHSLKLDSIFSINDCICDLYCIPSHFDYAYYVRVYKVSDKYKAVYARTEINDIFGHTIYCYPFESALKANKHSAKIGKIICGYFSPSENLISKLKLMKELFPAENCINDNQYMTIDGVWQVIRSWKNGSPENTVSFESTFAHRVFKKEFAETVCNMYEFIQNELK